MSKKIKLKDLENEKITLEELDDIDIDYDFPKYTTTILNLANRTSQGTWPRVVGQMTELVPPNKNKTQKEWEELYFERYPDAIDNATEKVYNMILNFREAMDSIDKNMVKEWVSDLVLIKSREGILIQEAILEHMAKKNNTTYRLSTPEEESKGIDGYIDEKPIQIKPETYLKEAQLQEEFSCDIIYYKKTKKYLNIYFEE